MNADEWALLGILDENFDVDPLVGKVPVLDADANAEVECE